MSEHTEGLITEAVACVNQVIEAIANDPDKIKELKTQILELFKPLEQAEQEKAWLMNRAAEAEAKKNKFHPGREAAKRIRAALKKQYPNVKFGVYPSLTSVSVKWEDGVPVAEVENAIKPDTALLTRTFSWKYANEVYDYVKNNIPDAKNDGVELRGGPDYGGKFGPEGSDNIRIYYKIARKCSSLEPIADQIKREQD